MRSRPAPQAYTACRQQPVERPKAGRNHLSARFPRAPRGRIPTEQLPRQEIRGRQACSAMHHHRKRRHHRKHLHTTARHECVRMYIIHARPPCQRSAREAKTRRPGRLGGGDIAVGHARFGPATRRRPVTPAAAGRLRGGRSSALRTGGPIAADDLQRPVRRLRRSDRRARLAITPRGCAIP